MVSHMSMSGSKSTQVTRTLLSILVNVNNAVVSMVSTRPLISESSNPFNNPLVAVPKAPITIGIIVTFMLQFFQFPSKVRVFILFFYRFSFNFIQWSARTAKSIILQVLFLLVDYFKVWSFLSEIRWSVCMSKSHRMLCLFSRTDSGLCIYHWFI